jgi:UrcA family protein
MMFKKATLSLAAVIAVLAPVAAHANDIENVSITVNAADLDLRSAKDQNRLNARIKSAARAVCNANSSRSLSDKVNTANCMSAAIVSANQQADIMIAASKAGQGQAVNTVAVLPTHG